MRKPYVFMLFSMVTTTISFVMATTILLQRPEDVVKQAPLVVDVIVKDIQFKSISNLSTGEAWITLSVLERVVGECPSQIVIRRGNTTPDLRFLATKWDPSYSIGEHFIICLFPTAEGYSTMGLYNGKFCIERGYIKGTQIRAGELKQQIHEIRNGQRSNFPNDLPRQTAEGVQKGLGTLGKVSRVMTAGSHLNGEFVTWDFTWNTSYVPVQMHYNSANAPNNTPDANTIANRASTAYSLWADTYSLLTIQNGSPFTTSAGRVDDNFSVVLWYDPGNTHELAETHTYPNDLDNSIFYGPNSNSGVDVWFNPIIAGTWYFGQTAPSSRDTSQVDWIEVLAHELGHGIGLRHVSNTNSIMYPAYLKGSVPVRNQSDGDLAGRVYQHTVENLSGNFTHSTFLSANRSTFNATGNLLVPASKTFEIEAGKTLSFTGYYKLRVEGVLNANGTYGNPVTFQGSGYPGSWFGIELYISYSSNSMNYCTIKDASYGLNLITSHIYPQQSIIRDNTYLVNCSNYSDPQFSTTVFGVGDWGVYGDETSAP